MNADITECKAHLRRELRARRLAVSDSARIELSRLACALLRGRSEWTRAKRILFYHPLGDELDLRPALREALSLGKEVALPRYRAGEGNYEAALIGNGERDLRPGWAGIPEPAASCPPIPLNRLDLVLVPGVGFDCDGRRLGRGKGFYDRLLAGVRGVRCGVAGEWQVVGQVPTQPHDERVDCILTPTRWIDCRLRERSEHEFHGGD